MLNKLKIKLQDLLSQRRFYPLLTASLAAILIIVGAVFIFFRFLDSLDKTLNKPIIELPPFEQGIDFKAVDKIALKLGIEIPARNIPSEKYLARNDPPKIFNFTSIRSRVLPQETITVFLNVYDPEGDQIEVSWSSSDGTITPIGLYGPARWAAPQTPGKYEIEVSVTDKKPNHRPQIASLGIEVIPRPIGEIPPQEIPEIATALVGLVKEEGKEELYLTKYDQGKFYKRRVFDNRIIDFYPGLTLNDVQIAPPGTLDEYILTDWVRGKDRTAVYRINPDGTKQHYKMLWEDFIKIFGGSDQAIFTVTDGEIAHYRPGPDILP